MPEFVMEGRDHAARAESAFVLGFIEALFFTECGSIPADEWFATDVDERTNYGQLPCDVGYTDLHPESLQAIRRDCGVFQILNAAALESAYATGYDAAQAGRDYWHTRNGHGVGFWDRGLGDVGDALSDAARADREAHVFFGDHVTHGDAPFVHVDL